MDELEQADSKSPKKRFTGRDLVELLRSLPPIDAEFAADMVRIHAESNTPVRDPWAAADADGDSAGGQA